LFYFQDMTGVFQTVLRIRDPVPFLTRDPGWVKFQIRDEHTGSYSESLETIFRLKFFDADPGIFQTLDLGSRMEKIQIRDKHLGSVSLGVNIQL
jgi:hypothetical protein